MSLKGDAEGEGEMGKVRRLGNNQIVIETESSKMDSEVSELLPRSFGVTLICLLPQQKATGV